MKPKLHQIVLASCLGAAACVASESPSAALLGLNKGDNTLAMIDPVAAKVIARLPAGPDRVLTDWVGLLRSKVS